jgi:hypothetical protein
MILLSIISILYLGGQGLALRIKLVDFYKIRDLMPENFS